MKKFAKLTVVDDLSVMPFQDRADLDPYLKNKYDTEVLLIVCQGGVVDKSHGYSRILQSRDDHRHHQHRILSIRHGSLNAFEVEAVDISLAGFNFVSRITCSL